MVEDPVRLPLSNDATPRRRRVASIGVVFACTWGATLLTTVRRRCGAPRHAAAPGLVRFLVRPDVVELRVVRPSDELEVRVDRFAADLAADRVSETSVAEGPLLALLLANALDSVVARRRDQAAREIRDWVCASAGPGLFSFDRACESLDLNPTIVRRRIGMRRRTPRHVSRRGLRRGPRA